MRTLIFIIALAIACESCTSSKAEAPKSEVKDQYLSFYGNWVGSFNPYYDENDTTIIEDEVDGPSANRINIIIKKISRDLRVTAESVVAGNKRKLKGRMEIMPGSYRFSLREPGNDKNDGVFEFTISEDEKNNLDLKGVWTSFNRSVAVPKREYELVKQAFRYNKDLMLPNNYTLYDSYDSKKEMVSDTVSKSDTTDEYVVGDTSTYEVYFYERSMYAFAGDAVYKINASNKKLNAEELKDLKKLELEIIRNTIFARHGYTFKKRRMRQFFDFVDWYIPVSTNITKELTPLEKENIELLLRFENYATNYYDSFGR